ncbi:type VII secretion protein EccB [Pseudonocardia sp.]|uniref:type VII secretion protein EccB n=1 Tax=Pseudonocardia sp. TaxID=60912 RepID=UPI003D11B68F
MVRPTAPAPVRTPATRDQADAYRFGVRRVEAALVRGDTVLLHEQLRAQRRAAFAGVLLALLVLGGVAAHGRLTSATDWTREKLVVATTAGTMFAVVPNPSRLVPVANLAAGRLLLAVYGVDGGSTAVPTPVADAQLAGAPRTAAAAVPGASGVHPDGPGPAGGWAVCDTVGSSGLERTTVVAGVAPGGPAGTGAAVLAEGAGQAWVIADHRRYRVDPGDRAVLEALGADRRAVRQVGAALLASIPEGPELTMASRDRSGDWPRPPARWADAVAEPVLCRVATPADPAHPQVVAASVVPVAAGAVTVDLAQGDGAGPRADAVALGAGAGGPVRLASDPARLALVSTTGVLHPITDDRTAEALGVGDAAAAPDWALRLLPVGPGLDLDATTRMVDVLDRVG